MTDTPTPADVAEAADKLQSWLDGDQTGIDEDAVQVAVNVMRSAPPAPGNGAAVPDVIAAWCASFRRALANSDEEDIWPETDFNLLAYYEKEYGL